ncbi:MAG: M23 family metallopeptidase [Caulobacteraceae bacterium]
MIAELALAAATSGPPPLAWPIACEVGRTCFVQNYFDHDPGQGAKDYACGSMSYQGHDGTDIRLPSLAQMRAGVTVLAAAPGVVRGIRDGVEDVSIRSPNAPPIKGRECGNGVRIDHEGGWATQYCHMKKGSIRVKPGARVNTGDALGQVGLSGDTEFPHLHFSISQGAAEVDPFAFGAQPGACRAGRGLWTQGAAARIAYRSPSIILRGFASAPVTAAEVDEGQLRSPAVRATSPALVAYVRAIGLEQGDVLTLRLIAPNGKAAAEQTNPPLDRAKAQYMMFVGQKAPPGGFARGTWRAEYTVRRAGRVVLNQTWTATL